MLTLLFLLPSAVAECMPLSIGEVTVQARVLMSQGEPALALQRVDEAIASLPCRSELIRVQELSELYQVGGTAARQAERPERWRELYSRAAAMVYPAEFFGNLGDTDREIYEDLLTQRPSPSTAWLVVGGPVVVDGYELSAGVEQGVVAGEHLVQELLPDGTRRSTMVTVENGGRESVGASPVAPAPASRRGRTGLAVTGIGLIAAGSTSLVAAGFWQESLGYNRGAEAVRGLWPDNQWEGYDTDTAQKRRIALACTVSGLTGVTVGTALLGGAFIFSNDSITFVKTW